MILFVYGPDTFRSREQLKRLTDQFQTKRDETGLNVVHLSGDNLDFTRLRQECMTQGFLAEKKMIVIDRILEQGNADVHESVYDFVKDHTDEDNVLLFFESGFVPKKTKKDAYTHKLFELLKKQKFAFMFPELSESELTHWITERTKHHGSTIEPQAISELKTRIGVDLWRMSHEVHKLSALKHNNVITKDDVVTYVEGVPEERIFALTDAIAQRNTSASLKLLEQEKERGAHEIYLVTMIARQLRIMLQIADVTAQGNTNAAKIAKQLSLHPFVVKKTLPLVQKYTPDDLRSMYKKLVRIDTALKSSHPNPSILLNLLVINKTPA